MKFCANPKCEHHVEHVGGEVLVVQVPTGMIRTLEGTDVEQRLIKRVEWRSPTRPGSLYFCERCASAIAALHKWEVE